MEFNKRDFLVQAGLRLKEFRQKLGYTRSQFARRLGFSYNGYRKIENGDNLPRPATLFRFSDEYDISMDWFLFNKGPRFNNDRVQKEQLQQLQAQLEKEKERTAALETQLKEMRLLKPEILEMVDYMEKNSLLNYKLLLHFHQFKQENKEAGTN